MQALRRMKSAGIVEITAPPSYRMSDLAYEAARGVRVMGVWCMDKGALIKAIRWPTSAKTKLQLTLDGRAVELKVWAQGGWGLRRRYC